MKRLAVFPLIKVDNWTFRTSIADHTNIMIMAFGPESQYMLRYFTDENLAKAWIDEVLMGKHVE